MFTDPAKAGPRFLPPKSAQLDVISLCVSDACSPQVEPLYLVAHYNDYPSNHAPATCLEKHMLPTPASIFSNFRTRW